MPKATPEDLMNAVIAADDLRRKARGLSTTRVARGIGLRHGTLVRLFIEPFFNVLGLLWGQFTMLFPASVRRPFIQWANSQMSGHAPIQTPALAPSIERTVETAVRIRQETGRWPALLLLTSHPETEGPHQWLRFELLRQGLQIADAVMELENPGRLFARHPQCFLAVDPFALDTVSAPVGAFYSAWVHRIYLAWDRQPSTQSWIQKHLLLRGTDYSRIAWRLLKTLRKDIPVLMVLAGGLPCNARLLYAAREFIRRLPIKGWRIRKLDAQLQLLKILMKPESGVCAADGGAIGPATLREIRDALARWGTPPEMVEPAIQDLVQEFKLPAPYRERLFRILIKRLSCRGKPLLIVGLNHRETAPYILVSDPCEVPANADSRALARHFARFFSDPPS